MTEKFNIAFYGKIKAGMDSEAVKQNLVRLTKKDSKRIDALFSGKRVVLKQGVDSQTAEKFKAAFEKSGAACEIEAVDTDAELTNLTMEKSSAQPKEKATNYAPMNTCPNCGLEQIFSEACQQCGIVFDKLPQDTEIAIPSTEGPPPLSEKMQEAVARAKMIGTMSVMQERKRHNRRRLFKMARIGLLASILITIATYTTCTNSRIAAWKETLNIVVYPINGDQVESTGDYINALDAEQFNPIETFMAEEASSYDIPLKKPVTVHLAPEIRTLPPEPPENQFPLFVVWWSLKMRYWAFKHDTYPDSSDIRIYVIYKATKKEQPQMEVSVGLRKGLIGVVNTSPEWKYDNHTNVIITHELLHTLGASDKYSYETMAPVHPDGYAYPDKEPLYPQVRGEIMAVRIPISENSFAMPNSLNDLVVGDKTCMEIHWCEKEGD